MSSGCIFQCGKLKKNKISSLIVFLDWAAIDANRHGFDFQTYYCFIYSMTLPQYVI